MAPLPGTSGADCDGKLAKGKVIDETKWLVYCCCEGVGLGPFSDPLIGAEAKQLCIRSSASTTDINGPDGLCNATEKLFCITEHFQLPPLKDAPKWKCFNKEILKGSFGSTSWHPNGILEESATMNDTFWINYCICGGCGVGKIDTFFAAQSKELCCRGMSSIEPPVVDGILCSSVQTQLCFWGECQMPPHKPNPTIAICTWRLNKDKAGGPAQVEMK